MNNDRVTREGFQLAGMLAVLLAGTGSSERSMKKQFDEARRRYANAIADQSPRLPLP